MNSSSSNANLNSSVSNLNKSQQQQSSSSSSSSSLLNRIQTDDLEQVSQDPNYRKFMQTMDKILQSFDSIREWPDIITFLTRSSKAFLSFPNFPIIPYKLLLARRLSQCLSPILPAGVHQKTLEVYAQLFKQIQSPQLAKDYPVYVQGLFPFLPHATTQVKAQVYQIYEEFLLPLGMALRPSAVSFILSIVSVLDEDGSEYTEKSISLLDKVSDQIGICFFYNSVWTGLVMSTSMRNALLKYLLRKVPKQLVPEEFAILLGNDTQLVVYSLSCCLEDANILVQRNVLELLLQVFSLEKSVLSKVDVIHLMQSAVTVLLRKDVSLNRRIYAWLLGSGEKLSPQVEECLCSALKELFNLEPNDPKPYKIIISLLDKEEIGSIVADRLFLFMLKRYTQLVESKIASNDLSFTMNTFIEKLEAFTIWKVFMQQLIVLMTPLIFVLNTNEQVNNPEIAELFFDHINSIIAFITHFKQTDDETLRVHLPHLMFLLSQLLSKVVNNAALVKQTLEAILLIIKQFPTAVITCSWPLQKFRGLSAESLDIMDEEVFKRRISLALEENNATPNFINDLNVPASPTRRSSAIAQLPADISSFHIQKIIYFFYDFKAVTNDDVISPRDLTSDKNSEDVILQEAIVGKLVIVIASRLIVESFMLFLHSKYVSSIKVYGSLYDQIFQFILDAYGNDIMLQDVLYSETLFEELLEVVIGRSTDFDELQWFSRSLISIIHLRPFKTDHQVFLDLFTKLWNLIPISDPNLSSKVESILRQIWLLVDSWNIEDMETQISLLLEDDASQMKEINRFGIFLKKSVDLKEKNHELLHRPRRKVLAKLLSTDCEVRKRVFGWSIQYLGPSFKEMIYLQIHPLLEELSRLKVKRSAITLNSGGKHPYFTLVAPAFLDLGIFEFTFRLFTQLMEDGHPVFMEALDESHSFDTSTLIQLMELKPDKQMLQSSFGPFLLAISLLTFRFELKSQRKTVFSLHDTVIRFLASLFQNHLSNDSSESAFLDSYAYLVQYLLEVQFAHIFEGRTFDHHFLSLIEVSINDLANYSQLLEVHLELLVNCVCSAVEHSKNLEIFTLHFKNILSMIKLPNIHLNTILDVCCKRLEFELEHHNVHLTTDDFAQILLIIKNLLSTGWVSPRWMNSKRSRSGSKLNLESPLGVESIPKAPTISIIATPTAQDMSSPPNTPRHRNQIQQSEDTDAFSTLSNLTRIMKAVMLFMARQQSQVIYFESCIPSVLDIVDKMSSLDGFMVLQSIVNIAFHKGNVNLLQNSQYGHNHELNDALFKFSVVDVLSRTDIWNSMHIIGYIFSALSQILQSQSKPAALGRLTFNAQPKQQNFKEEQKMLIFLERIFTTIASVEDLNSVFDDAMNVYRDTMSQANNHWICVWFLRTYVVFWKRLQTESNAISKDQKKEAEDIFCKWTDQCVFWASKVLSREKSAATLDDPGETPVEDRASVNLLNTIDLLDYLAQTLIQDVKKCVDDSDKQFNLLNNIMYYLVGTTIKNRNSDDVVFGSALNCIHQICLLPNTHRIWKKDSWEYCLDGKLFENSIDQLKKWQEITRQTVMNDKDKILELVARTTVTTSSSLFVSRDQEIVTRIYNLKRLAFVLYSAPFDHFIPYWPVFQEKIVEIFKGNMKQMHVQVYFLIQVCFMRFSMKHCSSLWPTISQELIMLFGNPVNSATADNEGSDLIFTALAFLEYLHSDHPEIFQSHAWIFKELEYQFVHPKFNEDEFLKRFCA